MTTHIVKICKLSILPPPPPPPHPSPTQLNVSQVSHFISKTLKTVKFSQESHSFKPCTKAEIDSVEIKCSVFNAVWKFVSERVRYWLKKPHCIMWTSASLRFWKKREGFIWKHIQNYLLTHVWKHQPIRSKVASAWSQFLYKK